MIMDIIEASGAEIVTGRTRAAFAPREDQILMPEKDTFKSDAHYYGALLHELAHWTGHESRLNRKFSFDKTSPEYAREELRAEMASAMLSMQLGIPPSVDNHEGYVAAYLKLLKDDKKEIFRAAKDAETISRFILRYSPELRERLEEEVRDQARAAADAGAPDEFFDASLFDEFEADAPALTM
jgi:antirestriction protein ArdC